MEQTRDGIELIPFRFTGKELDSETGLYYYGARYLDPKTSVWLSADPALGEYVPGAPIDDEAKKRNGNLPGMGGVFNTVNLHLYHYAGNNPIKYTDPDGRDIVVFNRSFGAGGFGHNAVMIGNDKDGWIFYSKNGGSDNTRQPYKTLGDFMAHNSSVPLEEQYDQASRVLTSKEQDKTMQDYGDSIYSRGYAFEESVDKSGNVKQNCADLVADIIDKAGNVAIGKPKIESGSSTRSGPYIWKFMGVELYFNKGQVKSPMDTNITWPNQQFEDFKNENGATNILSN